MAEAIAFMRQWEQLCRAIRCFCIRNLRGRRKLWNKRETIMPQTVLLVIDAQVVQFHPQWGVFDAQRIKQNIRDLVAQARTSGTPILFVRHLEDEAMLKEYGEHLIDLEPGIGYEEGDRVIDKTEPDAFEKTNLQQILVELGAEVLVLAGMQTDMCMTATSRRAAELGYRLIIASDAHSTEEGEISAAEKIATFNSLAQDFAQVMPAAEVEFA